MTSPLPDSSISFICAACGEPTAGAPCTDCAADPLLDGRYRLDRKRGAGSYAITWEATCLASGDRVCIKEMNLRRDHSKKVLELMQREVSVLKQLDHPSIPRYIEHIEQRSGKVRVLWLVVDYIDGTDLREELDRHRFTEREVLDLMEQLLEVLGYLHERSPPVIHRDVKPANIMRDADGRYFLVDFGSVRDALVDPDLGGSTLAPGTLGYMAPESYIGDVVPQTDLYGLGATAVALLARTDASVMSTGPGQLDWEDRITASGPTRAFLRSLLAGKPELRPSSAEAARDRVNQIIKVLETQPFDPDGQTPEVRKQGFFQVSEDSKSAWMMAFALLNLFTIQLAGPVIWYYSHQQITDMREADVEPDGMLKASRVVAILSTFLILIPFI